MAAGDLALNILITANASNAIGAFQGIGGTFSSLSSGLANMTFGLRNLGEAGTIGTGALMQGATQAGTALWQLGGMIALAGTAIAVKFGIDAVKAASAFQAGMTSLVTGAGETQSALGQVSQGILQMSIDTGTSTQQLTAGMYMVESAGYHLAQGGLDVLRVAAEGARVGNADLGATANTLTTILTDYHLKASDAAGAMNELITTVASGKTHLQDLANSMGSVLPLASSLGISFAQVGGAIATMTNSGMSAQRASMNLANTIRSLAAPSSAASKAMVSVGISAQQLHDTLTTQGLAAAIQMVENHVGNTFPAGSVKAVTAFKAIMGGATGYNVSLMLGGKNMAAYEANIKSIGGALQSGKSGVTGWAAVQQDFNFKLQQAQQAFEVLKIKVGQQLLPVISQLLTKITPLVLAFTDWLVKSGALQNAVGAFVNALMVMITIGSAIVSFFQNNEVAMALLKATLIVLAVIVGVVMVVALYSYAAAAYVAAAANIAAFWPVYLVIIIIIAVVALVILVVQHWGQIAHWLQGVWAAVASFFVWLWNGLVHGVQVAVAAIVGWFSWLYNHNYYFKMLVDFIRNAFSACISWLVGAWNNTVNWLAGIWNAIATKVVQAWQYISGIFGGAWNTYIAGPLGGLWNQFSGWFGNLANIAVQWGVNLVQGFINGIMSMAGAVGNAAQGIIHNVASFLGFHSPSEKGEGQHIVEWGQNMVKGFALGMQNAMPLINGQINHMIQAPNVALAGASAGNSFALSRPSSSNQPQTMNMQILLDGREITNVVGQRMAREMRIQGGVRSA